MSLTEKKRHEPQRIRRQTHERRRRTGLFLFVGLVVLTLLAVVFFGPDSTLESESGVVERAEDPTVAGPPEIVSEEEEEEGVTPQDPTLFLTVPKLGMFSHTVRNDDSEPALDLGAIKLPYTGFPWERGG